MNIKNRLKVKSVNTAVRAEQSSLALGPFDPWFNVCIVLW